MHWHLGLRAFGPGSSGVTAQTKPLRSSRSCCSPLAPGPRPTPAPRPPNAGRSPAPRLSTVSTSPPIHIHWGRAGSSDSRGRPGAGAGGGWSDSTAPPGAWARCPSLVCGPRPPSRATLPPVDAPSQPAFPFPHPLQSGVPGTRSFPARPWPCALPRLEGTPRLGPGSRPSSSRGPGRAGPREGRRGLASVARAAGGNPHPARSLRPPLLGFGPPPVSGADARPGPAARGVLSRALSPPG